MTPEQFCYWLHGWMELENPPLMTKEQYLIMRQHLDLVFVNVPKPTLHEVIYRSGASC